MMFPTTEEEALTLKRKNLLGLIGQWEGLWKYTEPQQKQMVDELVKRMGIYATESITQIRYAAIQILPIITKGGAK